MKKIPIKKFTKYGGKHKYSQRFTCFISGNDLQGHEHMFGDVTFCSTCIGDGECFCYTCINLKPATLKARSTVWARTIHQFVSYNHIVAGFSSESQLISYLGNKESLPEYIKDLIFKLTVRAPSIVQNEAVRNGNDQANICSIGDIRMYEKNEPIIRLHVATCCKKRKGVRQKYHALLVSTF